MLGAVDLLGTLSGVSGIAAAFRVNPIAKQVYLADFPPAIATNQ